MESGVPQGSVLAPEAWNYNTGDIPTTLTAHSDTAVYADDTSSATTHRDINKLIELAQKINMATIWLDKGKENQFWANKNACVSDT